MKLLSPGDAYTTGTTDGLGQLQLFVVECLVETGQRYGKDDALYRVRRLTRHSRKTWYDVVGDPHKMWGSALTRRMGVGGLFIGRFTNPLEDFTIENLIHFRDLEN